MIVNALAIFQWFNEETWEKYHYLPFYSKSVEFLENDLFKNYYKFLGYSDILESEIYIYGKKSEIYNETPYFLEIILSNKENKFVLPHVYLGVNKNTAYIYAIQNSKSNEKNNFTKKINRKLYKVNEGFDKNIDNYEIYEEGNLQDITPSFLLSLNITLNILLSNDITNIEVPSILIERWNAKEIANSYKMVSYPQKINLNEKINEHILIQKNLTEKLIRTFNRLSFHNLNINITSFPNELDSSLHLKLSKNKNINNQLLEETYEMNNSFKRK